MEDKKRTMVTVLKKITLFICSIYYGFITKEKSNMIIYVVTTISSMGITYLILMNR